MNKLIVFDVDGVLLDNKIGGFKEILSALGKEKEVKDIDEEYQKRKHLGPWGLEQLTALCQGFSQIQLENAALQYCQEKLMPNAKEVIALIKRKNYHVGAISSNPQFIMNCLAQILHLDFALGNEIEFKNNLATGKIVKKVDRYVKADLLKQKIDQYKIPRRNVVVVADSITDLPMKKMAGLFIGFNAKAEIKLECDVIIEKNNLSKLIKYL